MNSGNYTEGLNDKYAAMMNKYVSSLGDNATQSQVINGYKYFYKAQVEEEKVEQEAEATRELTRKGVDSKDQKFTNNCNSQVANKVLANAIRKKVKEDGYDFSKVSDDNVIGWYLKNNPSKRNEVNSVSSCKADMDTFLVNAGLEKKETMQGDSTLGTALGVLGAAGVGTAGLGVATLGSDSMGKFADWLYRQNINQSYKDANTLRERAANPQTLESLNKSIEYTQKLLDETQNSDLSDKVKQTQKEYYEKQLKSLNEQKLSVEKKIEKYSPENTPTTKETAYKYGIRGVSNKEIAAKAQSEADILWNQGIKQYLDNSTQSINLKEILDNLDADKIATLEGDKASVQAAIDMLKQEYKDPAYGKLSLSDANTIKSELYKKLPAGTWNGKNITNQYKQVLSEVSQILKGDTQSKLTQEFGEDFGLKFAEWGNLHEIATNETKELMGKGAAGGKLSTASAIVEGILTPISSEGGYYLKKANEVIKGAGKKIVEGAKNLFTSAKENPVETAKSIAKGGKNLLKENVAFAIGEEFINNLKEDVSSGYLAKSTVLLANKASKEQAIEWLKDSDFTKRLEEEADIDKIIKMYGISKDEIKEINTTIDNQNKQKAEETKKKLSGTKTEIENSSKVNPQIKKQTSLKSQKSTVSTKKKSSK